MKTSTLAFYLSILAPLASAAALPAYPEGVAAVTVTDNIDYPGNSAVIERDLDAIQKRADHAVYFCVNANFPNDGSLCVRINAPAGTCVPLGLDLEDKVSSVGPDQGAYCRFFFDRGCTDNAGNRHFDTVFPGITDLSRFGDGRANDQISSYQCFDQ